MNTHDPRMHGDPRNHTMDIEKLKGQIDRLKEEIAAIKATNAHLASLVAGYRVKERDCWRAVGW